MAQKITSVTTIITDSSLITVPAAQSLQDSKTADISISTPRTSPQITTNEQISKNVSDRLSPEEKTGYGEDVRSTSEDIIQLEQSQSITSTQENISRLQTAGTTVSNKNIADVQISRQVNQRTCNHKYSLITYRCIFCNKSRTSHVYDQ